MQYDAAVIGLGGMGSAVAAHLARRGQRVAGLEQFTLVHDLGASAGRSRIIRKAYFEDPAYVPLLERAYVLWRELEEHTQTALLDLFGVLVAGRADAPSMRGVVHAAQRYAIDLDLLDAARARTRFPALAWREGEAAAFEPGAGIVFPERAIAAHLRLARESGADLYERARVREIESTAAGVLIHLEGGDSIAADRVAVCAGPWASDVLASLGLPLRVQRNVQYWFATPPGAFGPPALPAFFLERDDLPAPLYGIPDLGDGLKIALHGYGDTTRAGALDRDIHDHERRAIRSALAQWIPDLADASLRAFKACMYTMTPDAHFALGLHPADSRIAIACGFSGHGFKFAPVIGEIIAQLLLDGGSPFDIGWLCLDRLIGET